MSASRATMLARRSKVQPSVFEGLVYGFGLQKDSLAIVPVPPPTSRVFG